MNVFRRCKRIEDEIPYHLRDHLKHLHFEHNLKNIYFCTGCSSPIPLYEGEDFHKFCEECEWSNSRFVEDKKNE